MSAIVDDQRRHGENLIVRGLIHSRFPGLGPSIRLILEKSVIARRNHLLSLRNRERAHARRPEHREDDEPADEESVASVPAPAWNLHPYPEPPKEFSDANVGVCDWCRNEFPVSNFKDSAWWRTHVLADLQPYVCLAGCEQPRMLFSRFEEWQDHMDFFHSEDWIQELRQQHDEWQDHMDFFHSEDWIQELRQQHDEWSDTRPKATEESKSERCPLCDEHRISVEKLVRHIASDLKSLSFISLNGFGDIGDNNEDEEDRDNGEDEDSDAASRMRISGSFHRHYYNRLDDHGIHAKRGSERAYLHEEDDHQSLGSNRRNRSLGQYDDISELGGSSEDENETKKTKGKNIIPTGLATDTTIHAVYKIYQSTQRGKIEHKSFCDSITEEEVSKEKNADATTNMEPVDTEATAETSMARPSLLADPATSTVPIRSIKDDERSSVSSMSSVSSISSVASTDAAESMCGDIDDALLESEFDSGRQFLPAGSLEKLVTAESIHKQLRDRSLSRTTFRILTDFVLKEARRVFLIVMCMDMSHAGRFVNSLREAGVTDDHLPIPHEVISCKEHPCRHKPVLSVFHRRPWHRRATTTFYRLQWQFIAPVFTPDDDEIQFDKRAIFPFVDVGRYPRIGAFSEVYEVKIHPDHHHGLIPLEERQELRVAVKETRMSSDDRELQAVFEQERRAQGAVRKLRHRHLIHTIASFVRGDKQYFIYSWADGADLRAFWMTNEFWPLTPQLVLESVQQISGLVDALAILHQGGWRHGDVKPENILRFTDETTLGTLKLGDLGLAKTHPTTTQQREYPTKTRMGTMRYEPPETVTCSSQPRSRKYDVWSMGCVIMEFAIWLLHGPRGLHEFSRDLSQDNTFGEAFYTTKRDAHGELQGKIHPVVDFWLHELSSNSSWPRDSVIGDLVELVRTKLLVVTYNLNDTAFEKQSSKELSVIPSIRICTDTDTLIAIDTALDHSSARADSGTLQVRMSEILSDCSQDPEYLFPPAARAALYRQAIPNYQRRDSRREEIQPVDGDLKPSALRKKLLIKVWSDPQRCWIPARVTADIDSATGQLVSDSFVKRLGHWQNVNQKSATQVLTPTGTVETLGTVSLIYLCSPGLKDRRTFSDEFHVFDNSDPGHVIPYDLIMQNIGPQKSEPQASVTIEYAGASYPEKPDAPSPTKELDYSYNSYIEEKHLSDKWAYIQDNDFAWEFFQSYQGDLPSVSGPSAYQFCERCASLNFCSPGFSATYPTAYLDENAKASRCNLCSLLYSALVRTGMAKQVWNEVQFVRRGSVLEMEPGSQPALSIVASPYTTMTSPTAHSIHSHIQLGLPSLPDIRGALTRHLLQQWLANCDSYHKCMPQSKIDRYLPTRLLMIEGGDSPTVRLVETVEMVDKQIPYITLSYVWGSSGYMFKRLLTSSYEEFRRGIPAAQLERTFFDAVLVAFNIGVSYLWIDSLCLIQDDREDIAGAVSNMVRIFQGSYCTISVNSAVSVQDGFLNDRRQRGFVKMGREKGGSYYVCDLIDDFDRDVEESPLGSRAWAFQERVLSRRTIFFTSTQVYWQCGSGIRCETLTRMANWKSSILGDPDFPLRSLETLERVQTFQQFYERYSLLRFTFSQDRPLAIWPLEKRLLQAFESEGRYGVIKRFLHRSLLWRRRTGQSLERIDFPEGRRVPSWSWQAYIGGISYISVLPETTDWKLIDCTFSNADRDHQSGADQESAKLVAEAWNFDPQALLADMDNHLTVMWDRGEHAKRKDLKCITIGTSKNESDGVGPPPANYLLIVCPTADGLAFERVGVGYIDGHKIATKPKQFILVL